MPECVADLRISASSESNDAPLDIGRGIKRKLDNSQEDQEKSQESERIENPSAPKRRRRSKEEGIVYKAKSSISSLFQSKYPKEVLAIEIVINFLYQSLFAANKKYPINFRSNYLFIRHVGGTGEQ